METEIIRFICSNCRFGFRRKSTWNEYICPNCGEQRVEREDTINKLINDRL